MTLTWLNAMTKTGEDCIPANIKVPLTEDFFNVYKKEQSNFIGFYTGGTVDGVQSTFNLPPPDVDASNWPGTTYQHTI